MDTIAAIAAGGGAPSAIGVVRVSGPDCFAACGRVFRSARPFGELEARRMVLGEFLDREGRVLDRGLAVRFPGPRSYTGEDSAEFHCHGSPVVLREVLAALFAAGARQAGPGEFTKRAFLNGRLDLTQAEAVIDLIDAETAAAARNAAAQLDGGLRRALEPIQEALLDITSRFYAVVDYPDEDIQDAGPEEIAAALRQAEGALTALLSTCKRGKVLKRGVRTAIVGLPNAGKSSLLNALAGYERAIVTDIPGTTRDTVEESVLCGGVLLRLIDTAGLRETEDEVERLGVERSRRAAAEAELALLVLDGSRPLADEDMAAAETARLAAHMIVLRNKSDLPQTADLSALELSVPVLSVSAREGTGLSALEDAVAELFAGDGPPSGEVLTNERQAEALRQAREAIRGAREALAGGLTPDAVLSDAERAMSALEEVTGQKLREDLTARIFERFCVGK